MNTADTQCHCYTENVRPRVLFQPWVALSRPTMGRPLQRLGRVGDLQELAGGDAVSANGLDVMYFMPLPCLPCPRHASRSSAHLLGLHKLLCDANPPCWRAKRPSTFRAELRKFQSKEWGEHASASNFSELSNSDGLRHHPSKYRVFARVSGNVGTTNGLHVRRLAAVRRASPRCGQDRGLLTAKY
jgi:hypothetical protein